MKASSSINECLLIYQEVKPETNKNDTSEKIPEKEVTTPSKDEEVKDESSAEEVEEKVTKSPKKEAPKKKSKPAEETKKQPTPKRKKAESESEDEEGSTKKQSDYLVILCDFCFIFIDNFSTAV